MKFALCLLSILSAVTAISDLEKQVQIQHQQIESLHKKVLELTKKSEKQELQQRKNAEVQNNIWQHIRGMERSLEIEKPEIYSKSFFSAQLLSDATVGDGVNVPFDYVTANYGLDYIQAGSIYIAPEDGYYAFIFGGRERGSSSISGSVVKISGTNPNDIDTLCSFTGGNDDWQTQACSAITDLLQGDQVTVVSSGSSQFGGSAHTTFSGFQLRTGLS